MYRVALVLLLMAAVVGAKHASTPALAISFPAGWNLVAGPTGSTLKGAASSLYTLQPGDTAYEQVAATSPLTGGYAYWAYFPNGGELLRGAGSASYSVALQPGQWAMVGNPASWAAATISGADSALTYTAAGGYQRATTLAIGQGAWVLGTTAVTLTAPPITTLSIAFDRRVSGDAIPQIGADHTAYLFNVAGVDLTALALSMPTELARAVQISSGRGTVLNLSDDYGLAYTSDAGQLIIGLRNWLPSDTYTVMLTLPDGRQAQAAFAHTTTATTSRQVYLGASVDGLFTPDQPLNFTPLSQFQLDAGKAPAIVQWYQDWGTWQHDPPTVAQLRSVAARGAVSMITWSPELDSDEITNPTPPFSLTRIAAGTHDVFIRSFANALKAYGGPVLLRFAHEMNGDWYQWGAGVGGNTPAQYVAAWRHVHDVFMAQGATNVKWVWCPNVLTGAAIAFEPFYPGDAYVDWLGLDGYNNVLWGDWQTFSQIFAASYQAITALSQHPLMIAETASGEAGGDKAVWITDALVTQIPNHFPLIDAVVWFNFNDPPDSADFRIESSRSAMAAFRAAVSSAVYRTQWP